jgi:sporulation protein YlmC with PRC-barrel domain
VSTRRRGGRGDGVEVAWHRVDAIDADVVVPDRVAAMACHST